ncbi:MAG: insecticidal toxin complex protein, partial [Bacteroidota bacterium]
PIPMIDLVNESLEHMVESGTSSGIIYNTSEDEILEHALLQNDQTEQVEGELYRHNPVELLDAIPEHSSPSVYSNAYDKLKIDFSDTCCLPYNQALDVSRTYLEALGVSRYEKMRRFRKEITEFVFDPENPPADFPNHAFQYPVKTDIAIEYLCISPEEYNLLYTQNLVKIPATERITYWEVYGYTEEGHESNWSEENFINEVSNLCQFLKISCLSYEQFLELWRSEFITFSSNQAEEEYLFPIIEPCDCSKYQIGRIDNITKNFIPLSINDLKKLIVFIRLWHKRQKLTGAKYSFLEWRDICKVLKLFNGNNINPNFIRKLAAFQMLKDDYQLSLSNANDSGGVDAERSHLLALWVGENATHWDWAVDHLLKQIQQRADELHATACRPANFIKILKDNLNKLSLLSGFDPNTSEFTWHHCPTHTLRFAEILSKIYNSSFSVGEIIYLFTADNQLLGDAPLPLQSQHEALEFPFDQPDNETDYTLHSLRKKLLEIEISEEEIRTWDWLKIVATLEEKFGYAPTTYDPLQSIGTHFFPTILGELGYIINNADKQYRTNLSRNDTAPRMWNTPADSVFRYDPSDEKLWTEIAMMDEAVIEKLSEIRSLNDAEQKAVQELYFLPRLDLAHFSFLFSKFDEAQELLIQQPDEIKRFNYFQRECAYFFKRCEIIAAHLGEHIISATNQSSAEGIDLAWKVLTSLRADGDQAKESWEYHTGRIPDTCWSRQPNGGAFAAILGLLGTGWKESLTVV